MNEWDALYQILVAAIAQGSGGCEEEFAVRAVKAFKAGLAEFNNKFGHSPVCAASGPAESCACQTATSTFS